MLHLKSKSSGGTQEQRRNCGIKARAQTLFSPTIIARICKQAYKSDEQA